MATKCVIFPYEGVEIADLGILRFGMTRQEVRDFFGEEPFRKSEEQDMYESFWSFPCFDKNGFLTAVEFSREVVPVLHSKELLALPYHEVTAWLQALDPDSYFSQKVNITTPKYGVSLWAPFANDPEEPDYRAESALAYRRGYRA